jgi:hypothetical protein
MHLTRCQGHDAKPHAFEELYAESRMSEGFRRSGEAMLRLIERLKALPDGRRVYGLISAFRLCLLAEDTYLSPWFVVIEASDQQTYHVEYLMPERLGPWANARVRGEARSEDEAVQMILTAMERSEGWSRNGRPTQ